MPSDETDNAANLEELNENLKRVDELTQRMVLAFTNKNAGKQELAGPDQQLYIKAASAYLAQMMSDPAKLMESQVSHFRRSLEHFAETRGALTGDAAPDTVAAKPKANTADRRFSSELWETNPFFNMIKQQYLLSSEAIEDAVGGIAGLEPSEKKQIGFFSRQIVDLFSPTNFLGTNPEALTKALETNGQSLVDGLENLVRDLETNEGELAVTLSDPSAFEVGGNIATTPGAVVYQNHMFQLLQYTPTSEQAHSIPLLIVPPWINKFYILDLKERNSFIRFAVEQGFTVFVVSWVNPDASYRDVGFDTYMHEGLIEAITQVKAISGEPRINVIGYCIGGTLLATGLAYMARCKDNSVKSATFFTTLTDFSDSGELSVFIDDGFLTSIEQEVDEKGYLEAMFMSRTFSYLRANDLVYGPAIRSYLMGDAPPAFDLLYWNSDSTNLPARMAKEYLRKLYQDNELARGEFVISGEKLKISDIRIPIFVIATKTDHIAPWQSSFKGLNKVRGNKTFVLAGSGHIAGIVNPANSTKYGYWTNSDKPADIDQWYNDAKVHDGSWWNDWAAWLAARAGKKITARNPGDNPNFREIEPAPGSYVKKKAK